MAQTSTYRIVQGEALEFYLVSRDEAGVEVDMTGYEFQGEVETPEGADVATLTCTLTASPLTSVAARACRVTLSAGDSITIPLRRGYVFDIFRKAPGGDPEYFYGGTLDVTQRVTEWA